MDLCKFCHKKFNKKYILQIFCSLLCSNRFNLNNKNNFQLPQKHSSDLAEFFGILLGDGSVTKYFTKVYLNAVADIDYVPCVKNLLERLFIGVSVSIWSPQNKGTTDLQVSSKDVCDYLRNIGFNAKKRYIPSWITENSDFSKATIRGLFDTEGSVGMKYFKGKHGNYLYKQLTVTNKNENILRFLEKFLVKFGYKPTKNSEKNIYLSNTSDINRYLQDIGCSNPKLVNKIKVREINGFKYQVKEGWQRGRSHES